MTRTVFMAASVLGSGLGAGMECVVTVGPGSGLWVGVGATPLFKSSALIFLIRNTPVSKDTSSGATSS